MNDLEKTQSLLAQEASEQVVQEKPAAFQEHYPTLDEEQLGNISGGSWPSSPTSPKPLLQRSYSAPARLTEGEGPLSLTSSPTVDRPGNDRFMGQRIHPNQPQVKFGSDHIIVDGIKRMFH
jgi:hypothetical protein